MTARCAFCGEPCSSPAYEAILEDFRRASLYPELVAAMKAVTRDFHGWPSWVPAPEFVERAEGDLKAAEVLLERAVDPDRIGKARDQARADLAQAQADLEHMRLVILSAVHWEGWTTEEEKLTNIFARIDAARLALEKNEH